MTAKPATPGARNTPAKRQSARTVEIRRKQAEAVRLFVEGVPLRIIAERVGYESKAGVSRAIKSVLDRSDSDEADALRSAHAERIGMGYRTVLEVLNRQYPVPTVPPAMDAAEGAKWVDRVVDVLEERAELRLKAVDRLVRLLERESRLHGLDEPVKITGSVDGPMSIVVHPALMPMMWRQTHGFDTPGSLDDESIVEPTLTPDDVGQTP